MKALEPPAWNLLPEVHTMVLQQGRLLARPLLHPQLSLPTNLTLGCLDQTPPTLEIGDDDSLGPIPIRARLPSQ